MCASILLILLILLILKLPVSCPIAAPQMWNLVVGHATSIVIVMVSNNMHKGME
jgi:hypothetical protein